MEVEIDCDDFRVSYQRGTTGVAVVAFTGIGHGLGAIQTEEFRRSLAPDGGEECNSVIYVIDKKRKWYNDGLIDPIRQSVNNIIDRTNTANSVTLGNSMGGFGAIIFAGIISKCSRAIAFCPQSSVKDDIVPFDRRWPEWRTGIARWDVFDALSEVQSHIQYDLFFGVKSVVDMKHADRFAAGNFANVNVHYIPDCDHNVAEYMKGQGTLVPTLRGLIGYRAMRGEAGLPDGR